MPSAFAFSVFFRSIRSIRISGLLMPARAAVAVPGTGRAMLSVNNF
jgi:hypothetical protein